MTSSSSKTMCDRASKTRSINIRGVPIETWRRVRRNAVDSEGGMPLRDYLIRLLGESVPFAEDEVSSAVCPSSRPAGEQCERTAATERVAVAIPLGHERASVEGTTRLPPGKRVTRRGTIQRVPGD